MLAVFTGDLTSGLINTVVFLHFHNRKNVSSGFSDLLYLFTYLYNLVLSLNMQVISKFIINSLAEFLFKCLLLGLIMSVSRFHFITIRFTEDKIHLNYKRICFSSLHLTHCFINLLQFTCWLSIRFTFASDLFRNSFQILEVVGGRCFAN